MSQSIAYHVSDFNRTNVVLMIMWKSRNLPLKVICKGGFTGVFAWHLVLLYHSYPILFVGSHKLRSRDNVWLEAARSALVASRDIQAINACGLVIWGLAMSYLIGYDIIICIYLLASYWTTADIENHTTWNIDNWFRYRRIIHERTYRFNKVSLFATK